jgi:Ni2+-binding GTPase involved in maturation of urease and hydrogenase
MAIPQLILVGGFLGAGKTTLLARAALGLSQRGHRVGLVANDQADDLVDSEILRLAGANVEEVAGGCFCCRFPDMIAALERLAHEQSADILLAEPVGSCTDLAATVMRPLEDLHSQQFRLAPLTVLVDGNQVRTLARLRAAKEKASAAHFPDTVLYIYEKQLEEADLIVLNKADRLAAGEVQELQASLVARFPGKPVLAMSAWIGDGVAAWLEFVTGERAAGQQAVEVDYDVYAAGEAALGWLNASVALKSPDAFDWSAFAGGLLEEIRRELATLGAEIAHLKLIISRGSESITGNLTASDAPVSLRGRLSNSVPTASMRINARVHISPEELQRVVEGALRRAAGERIDASITAINSFRPGRPIPTHRFAN